MLINNVVLLRCWQAWCFVSCGWLGWFCAWQTDLLGQTRHRKNHSASRCTYSFICANLITVIFSMAILSRSPQSSNYLNVFFSEGISLSWVISKNLACCLHDSLLPKLNNLFTGDDDMFWYYLATCARNGYPFLFIF